jgi:uncharacterized FlaG/YvyC family protein
MELTPLNRIGAAGSRTPDQTKLDRNEVLLKATAAVRDLNALDISGREFAIVWDTAGHKFVVRVMDRATGNVVDQFPPENILKMLSQFDPTNEPQQRSHE